MTAQPITGWGSNVIPVCHVPAKHRLWNDAIPACNAAKTLPIKESAQAQKDEKGR